MSVYVDAKKNGDGTTLQPNELPFINVINGLT